MKSKIFFLLFLISTVALSQPITVNTTTYTVPQLVQDVLFGNGTAGSSCVGTISNITWSTGSNFGSSNGIGYFSNTNPTFPMTSGVILSTGSVTAAPGPNTSTQSNGTDAWPGDTQLFNYIDGLGIDTNLIDYNNATILEFDFTPLTDTMSFDFLFASEEYGTFQCDFSDAFAFFLTDVTAATPVTNLALVPSTTTPISVVTIRDNQYNSGCSSENVAYFGNYNDFPNPTNSATNFNGETTLLTASSPVTPGHTYHIKLVIADRNDNSFDSAVFLGAGSFNIGSPNLAGTGTFDGLDNLTIADGTALCGSTAINIQAGTVLIPGVNYAWTYNGDPIAGANSNNYTVTQGGDYGLTITYPGGCQQSDVMTVEYYPNLPLGTPNDLTQANNPIFNLTVNSNLIVNGTGGPISYYTSAADAYQLNNPIGNPLAYTGTNGQEIFAAVEDPEYGCITVTSFFLYITTNVINPTTPPDLTLCESGYGIGTADFDFTPQVGIAYGSYSPSDYTLTFHTSMADATNGVGAISPINTFTGTDGQIIYIRLEDNTDSTIYGTAQFTLHVNPLPTVSISGTTTIC
uniref:choice-of-anchor L domain-containing protein n=1 Tax=Flavobacterium sp. TaxID=239 RepID=UPI0035AE7324